VCVLFEVPRVWEFVWAPLASPPALRPRARSRPHTKLRRVERAVSEVRLMVRQVRLELWRREAKGQRDGSAESNIGREGVPQMPGVHGKACWRNKWLQVDDEAYDKCEALMDKLLDLTDVEAVFSNVEGLEAL